MPRILSLLSLPVIFLLSSPVWAGSSYFSYTTEEGVVAFTDDPEKIPARYREVIQESNFEEARERTDRKMTSPAGSTEAEPSMDRLQRLREASGKGAATQRHRSNLDEWEDTQGYPITDTELVEFPDGTTRTAEVTRNSATGEIIAVDGKVYIIKSMGVQAKENPSGVKAVD